MNQTQREFLIRKINSSYNDEVERLKKGIGKKPSLNNYLVASFLDNSIQFNDIDNLKIKIRENVLKFGTEDCLIKLKSDRWGNNNINVDKEICEVIAEDLFIIPDNYKDELKIYNDNKEKIEKEISNITAIRDTILMKIQLGSNKVLDNLIEQADNLVDLDLVNTNLLLNKSENKQLNK